MAKDGSEVGMSLSLIREKQEGEAIMSGSVHHGPSFINSVSYCDTNYSWPSIFWYSLRTYVSIGEPVKGALRIKPSSFETTPKPSQSA